VDPRDVAVAAGRLNDVVVRTRSFASASISARTGHRVVLKAENEQRSGAFKFRGAVNAMFSLTPRQRHAGVVAGSSGNHGQAVALAARLLDTTAVVVLPTDAPAAKLRAVLGFGGEVVTYDRFRSDRDAVVAEIAAKQGRIVVSSYDEDAVIVGAGTVAAEFLHDAGPVDVLFVPVGGGGLAAGCGLASHALGGITRVVGVEPVGADDTLRSLRAGRRVRIPPPTTIADGLRHQTPGRLTFPLNRRLLDRVVVVRDTEITAAMRLLRDAERLVVEPSGACALAAVLAGRPLLAPGTRVGVVISGGNVDAGTWDSDAERDRYDDLTHDRIAIPVPDVPGGGTPNAIRRRPH
jgi:threo-3-hydroxy-L-aspartate ammonia-lyase